jgi:hypothetical protein
MSLAPNDKPISPSAISVQNRQRQLDEERIAGNSTVKPQRQETRDVPLFTHQSKVTPIEHPAFVQQPRGDMPTDVHPGASPTQSPNDSGRRSGGAA